MIDLALFGTRAMHLRPSSLPKLFKCPMSLVLSYFDESDGSRGLHTGSLVHRGVETFHRVPGGDPVAATEAMAAAVASFPEGDVAKARKWLEAYVGDPTNQSALVTAVELPVELEYKGVYLKGTLDQIRQGEDGSLLVWDVKTGTSLEPDLAVAEYQVQQAAYVLAARQTLGLDVTPGGLIFAAGYDKPRGRRFLPMLVDVGQCERLMDEVVRIVETVRAGHRSFLPSAGHCQYCPHKQYPRCEVKANGFLGSLT